MGDQLVNVTKNGNTIAVAPGDEGKFLAQGYSEESPEQHAARVQSEIAAENDPGALTAGVMSGLSGLTLGGTDALIAAEGGRQQLNDLYNAHPIARTVGNVAGAVAPAAFGDVAGLGDLLARTPAGFVTDIGSKVAAGLGGGLLGTAAAGAFEGAANNAGGYVSDVALGNRDLSAEGFLGAMGNGALYGGVSAGALSLASNGAIAARKLIPSFELTPEAVADAQTAATQGIRDSVDTSTRLEGAAQDQATGINRETQQFLQDLEAERAAALQESGAKAQAALDTLPDETAQAAPEAPQVTAQQPAEQPAPESPAVEVAPPSPAAGPTFDDSDQVYIPTANEVTKNGWSKYRELEEAGVDSGAYQGQSVGRPVGTPTTPEVEAPAAEQPEQPAPKVKGRKPKEPPPNVPDAGTEPPKVADDAKALLKEWRAKYPSGAVDYDEATKAARRGRLAEWAKNFVPKTPEDETIKAYFSNPMDPGRTLERVGGTDAPQAVKNAATAAAEEASHTAYHSALAQATNVSKSGAELMARATYAARKAAAQAMDDVYTAYRAGMPIIDIQQAASKKLTDQLHELVEARADMIHSLAGKPEAAQAVTEQLSAPTLGEKIVNGAPKAVDPDEAISKALGASKDVNEDIADLAPKITRYEAAKAAITESLAEKAPADAVVHAQAFRQAQEQAEAATAQNTAETAESINKLQRGVPAQKVAGGGKSLLKTANSLGTGYELLRDLGVPLPDPKSVPVIGPLLSMYLKAKVWSRLLRGKGGIFAETAEGTIAAKAAATRQRIATAVDTMLSGTAKVTAKAAELAGPMALSHKLFDDGTKQPYSSQPGGGSLEDNYQARLAELTAALKPGAIDSAVKSRIHTSDPTITNAIITAETQKAQYLYNTAPKPDGPPMPGRPQRLPSKAEIEDWSHVVAAAQDPAAVFEKVAKGGRARPSEIDCVNNCYPNLMAEAQKRFVEKIAKLDKPLPYTRRVAVSMLTGIPLDSTMTPDHAAFLQQGYSTPAAMPTPPMPHPSLSGDIRLGQQTLTRLDK